MREISPAKNASADYVLKIAPPKVQQIVSQIRDQKKKGTRPRPSNSLVDRSTLLTPIQRRRILDAVAGLVDENLFGRSEMCTQFADLLQRALERLNLPARSVIGTAIYYKNRQEIFRWKHAWVRIDDELVDGNVDSLFENPMVPQEVNVAPYWGPTADVPPDRFLREDRGKPLPSDEDVDNIWWPDLCAWLDNEYGERVADIG